MMFDGTDMQLTLGEEGGVQTTELYRHIRIHIRHIEAAEISGSN